MSLFSQRKGIKKGKVQILKESIDYEIRIGLWNSVTVVYWDPAPKFFRNDINYNNFFTQIWHNYFKWSIDTLNDFAKMDIGVIRAYFFKAKWYEIFDFIEFIANNFPNDEYNENFVKMCNSVLEREMSGYRFVGKVITEITSDQEIVEIEEAINPKCQLEPISIHLTRALELLSDRKKPDYRNSIKEAISAVESLCVLITDSEKCTLGQAIKEIEGKGILIHPALKNAFSNMYGYTNVGDGIRHALLEEDTLKWEDAKFMLVACSAFINYLTAKASIAKVL